jgi:transcriptional regulator with PAS, ATPase and Fis domain
MSDLADVEKRIRRRISAFFRALGNETVALQEEDVRELTTPDAIDKVLDTSLLLLKILRNYPESIYVTNQNGMTIFVNKTFKDITSVDCADVLGKTVFECEEAGYYNPSVHRLVYEEQGAVSILQTVKNGRKLLVRGIPLFGADGSVEMCMSNARPLDEVEWIYERYHGKRRTKRVAADTGEASFIAESSEMRTILEVVAQIRDTGSTVLILGESGVGKDMLAKYIHRTSARAKNPMICVNCGAIPEQLLESELFGYATGAFTGAAAGGKEGLVALADKGTLLLDEIDELPSMLQVKILHLIQEKQIRAIGAKELRNVDVRIIATSNRDLKELVKNGKFREDLYYRINVIPIEIPPLRLRKADLTAAVDAFVAKFQEKHGKPVVCDPSFLDAALSKPWPGNIRELENTIERLVLMNQNGVLTAEDILDGEKGEYAEPGDEGLAAEDEINMLRAAMERLEKRAVLTAHAKYKSSYLVAKALGISQSSAYRKIRKYTDG